MGLNLFLSFLLPLQKETINKDTSLMSRAIRWNGQE